MVALFYACGGDDSTLFHDESGDDDNDAGAAGDADGGMPERGGSTGTTGGSAPRGGRGGSSSQGGAAGAPGEGGAGDGAAGQGGVGDGGDDGVGGASGSGAGSGGSSAGGAASGGGGVGGLGGLGGSAGAGTGGLAGSSGSGGSTAGSGGSGGSGDVVYRSCAEWRNSGVRDDGVRRIDADGSGPWRAFDVFCAGMSAGPGHEYLELPHRDATGYPNMNSTTFAKPGNDACPCPSGLTKSYSKVRLRISDLTVLTSDRTYATFLTDPACHMAEPNCEGERLAYGEAGDCRGIGANGSADIDLGDTPFHIRPGAMFAGFGWAPAGEAVLSTDRKRAHIVGGGFCGGFGPAEPLHVADSWTTAGELPLELD